MTDLGLKNWKEVLANKNKPKKKKKGEDGTDGNDVEHNPDAAEDGNDDKEDVKRQKVVDRRQLKIRPDSFDVACLDEAHKAKSLRSIQSKALLKLLPEMFLLITATPTMNNIAELGGLLRFPWRQIQRFHEGNIDSMRGHSLANVAEKKLRYANEFGNSMPTMCEMEKQGDYYGFLDPIWFLGTVTASKTGDTRVATEVMGLINNMIAFRRVTGQTVRMGEDEIEIGAGIPTPEFNVIELEQDEATLWLYRNGHNKLFHNLELEVSAPRRLYNQHPHVGA